MKLSIYISELLIKNNCVVVPNFGGFIANYQSAVIDELRNKIYPPSKKVLFNPNLQSNDGLLANYVSIKIGESYSDSLNLIDNKVDEWQSLLKKGERINLGEIGFLYLHEDGIKFEQNREFNILLDAYGLSSVRFIPQIEEEAVVADSDSKIIQFSPSIPVVEELKAENTDENQIEFVRQKSNRWKYIAVACMLPALFYSYWIPMNTSLLESGNVQMSDFNPLNEKAAKIYTIRKEKNHVDAVNTVSSWSEISKALNGSVSYYNYKFNEELYIPVNMSESLNENSINSERHIHLIAGCFSNENNAKALVIDLKSKGYTAFILDKNKGLYRVSAESFDDKSEAKITKSKLLSESISTWILNK